MKCTHQAHSKTKSTHNFEIHVHTARVTKRLCTEELDPCFDRSKVVYIHRRFVKKNIRMDNHKQIVNPKAPCIRESTAVRWRYIECI